jgi:hypothetical protein
MRARRLVATTVQFQPSHNPRIRAELAMNASLAFFFTFVGARPSGEAPWMI